MIHVNADVISKVNAEANVNNKVVRGIVNETVDYITQVKNKPSINGITLKGNRTSADLGLQPAGDYATMSDIPTKVSELDNDSGYITDEAIKKPKVLFGVPCDDNGNFTYTSLATHYQVTSEEYIDYNVPSISHWYSGEELANIISTCETYIRHVEIEPPFNVIMSDFIPYYLCQDSDTEYLYPVPNYNGWLWAVFNDKTYGMTIVLASNNEYVDVANYDGLVIQQVNWSNINPKSPYYIANKPTRLSQFTNDSGFITSSALPTKTSDLQNDSGFITSADLPSPSFILAIPFDENDVMLGTPTAYYQFTKREYIDTATMAVSHWFSAEEMVAMGNMLLYCYPVMIGFGVVVTNLLHHYCYRDMDGYYQTYTTTQLESQQEAWQELTGENGNYIHVQLVDNSTILPIAKGYDRKVRLSTFDNDANYVQDAHYVHIDGVSNNAKQANGILLGKVDADSTATVMKATVPSLNELYDGACVYLMNGIVTSASGWTLNVNGLGAKPVYQTLAQASRSTTIFNVNYTMMFVYNSQRVEGGCWDIYYGYNSDTNTTAYQVRSNGTGYLAQAKFYRYRLLFEAMDGVHVVPANTSTSTNATTNRTPNSAPFNPFGRIFYYSTTTAIEAEANCSASYLWERYAGISLGYSFAKGSALTMTFPKAVYLKCTPQADNTVVLDATDPYVQDLPSAEDGSVYIYLGQATSATAIELAENHPVYQYKSGKICLFTGN